MHHENRPDASWMLSGLDDVTATAGWLERVRRRSVREVLPAIALRLDCVLKLDLDPEVRLGLMRLYKRPVLKVCAALPNPDPRRPQGGFEVGSGLTAEQRLDRLMRMNLGLLFQELDKKRYRCAASTEENRQWVICNLFKFFRRQIRYAMLIGRPCPRQTWQDLHDLFVYLVIRGNVQLLSDVEIDAYDDSFSAEAEYKRLLLLGNANQRKLTGKAALDLLPLLPEWARRSKLMDPDGHRGGIGLMLVEVSHDRPMRRDDATLNQGFRGWVMLPPDGYTRFMDRHAGEQRRGGQSRAA
jgi:hypothetical protein